MADILNELRVAIQHEIALAGPWVPLARVVAPPAQSVATQPDPAASVQPKDNNVASEVDGPTAMEDLFGQKTSLANDPATSPYKRIEALIPEDNPIRAMKTLDELREYMAAHELVPIDKNRINPVFGVGDPDADLMIVGEAPGADEDRQGEPFVGRAGQLLNKILEAVNFKREDVYICNILKSRPPNNRDPLPEEVEAHIPALYKQIALIQPKIILCVGKTSANALLGRKSSLGGLRDKVHDFYGLPLIVTYHPAALLRNEQWKRPTWEDMKLLRTRYDQLTKTVK
jgi:uracil-DNA glycosylase